MLPEQFKICQIKISNLLRTFLLHWDRWARNVSGALYYFHRAFNSVEQTFCNFSSPPDLPAQRYRHLWFTTHSTSATTTNHTIQQLSELQIFQFFSLHNFHSQPADSSTCFTEQGLMSRCWSNLINIIQPCLRNKVKRPCVRHNKHQHVIQPSSFINQIFNGVQSPFSSG